MISGKTLTLNSHDKLSLRNFQCWRKMFVAPPPLDRFLHPSPWKHMDLVWPPSPKHEWTNSTTVAIWRACFQNLLHSLLHATHLQLRSLQRSPFSTQNWLQMKNVHTNFKNSNSIIVRIAFWPCHKIWTYIKKHKGIKSCLIPKPLLSTPAFPAFIPTFNHFVVCKHCALLQMKITHNRNIFYETWTILIAIRKSIMQSE